MNESNKEYENLVHALQKIRDKYDIIISNFDSINKDNAVLIENSSFRESRVYDERTKIKDARSTLKSVINEIKRNL